MVVLYVYTIMNNIEEYRSMALEYLGTRVRYFNEETDDCLDTALRQVSNLPMRPEGHDQYNGILGHKPVVEQRLLCIKLLRQRLRNKTLRQADLSVDKAVRVLNNLPSRPNGNDPYSGLFKLDNPPKQTAPSSQGKVKATTLKVSNKGIDLIHSFESYRATTYKDPGSASGLPITGGWGSTRLNGKKLQLGVTYSRQVWDTQFAKDLAYFEANVRERVKVPITQSMYDALVSFTYNCGVGNFSSSTALRRLNKGDYRGCVEALQWWNKGANGRVLAGLVRRRKAEGKLFLTQGA